MDRGVSTETRGLKLESKWEGDGALLGLPFGSMDGCCQAGLGLGLPVVPIKRNASGSRA